MKNDERRIVSIDLDSEEVQALLQYAIAQLLADEIKRRKTPALLQPKENWRDNYNPC
jgi:hypothetical protein